MAREQNMEASVKRKRWKRKLLVLNLVVSAVAVVSLICVLIIVPLMFGDSFMSCSFELSYITGPYGPSMKIVYVNGSVISVWWIGLWVNVTNKYVAPVQIRYNGFDFVWLIYNRTVKDPANVVGNKDSLMWGAFETVYSINGWGMWGFDEGTYPPDRIKFGNMTGYEYYLSRKDLSNYTITIPRGTSRCYAFYEMAMFPDSSWHGQNLLGNPVSPGTYHMYLIAYGKFHAQNEPINITVTSVLWPTEK